MAKGPQEKQVGSAKPRDEEALRFPPDEEKELLEESNRIKVEANGLFGAGKYEDALAKYDEAVETCPKYLHFERAVLQSNTAACHLQLKQWKEAIKTSTTSLDSLAALEREHALPENPANASESSLEHSQAEEQSPTTVDVADEAKDADEGKAKVPPHQKTKSSAHPIENSLPESRKDDVRRIRTKALLRRARGRSEAGGWQNLTGAQEDYQVLSSLPGLTAADTRTVQTQLRTLKPRVKAAQEAEMGEMWGKLKQLGDGILKPFGLSTNNFQMVQDKNTGGYSVNFSQDGKPGK